MTTLKIIDRALLSLIGVILIATLVLYATDKEYFSLVFAAEDGPVEYGTAVFLFVASLVLAGHAGSLIGQGRKGAAVLMAFYALMFFLAAGEEVSWGQRIFGWESGEFFQENNYQDETNLHNLVVGGAQLAKTLFGSFLTTVILIYLVVLPVLYSRTSWVPALANRLVAPMPWMHHGAIALVASIVIAVIDVNRKWEVYELIFSLLVVSIFLLPQNRDKIT